MLLQLFLMTDLDILLILTGTAMISATSSRLYSNAMRETDPPLTQYSGN
jgi:hypothetical protein